MRTRRQFVSTLLFLIGAVVVGSLYAIVPARQALVTHQSHVAATATSAPATPTPTQETSIQALPALTVRGTQIVDATGRQVTLIGASRSSLEYACAGDGHFTDVDFAAMRAWGMNVVRLPLSSAFWNTANATDTACPGYQRQVQQAVRNAEQAGLYVILDLQWDAPFDTPADRVHGGAQCPLPDARADGAFWRDIASRFADDPQVIFDLFGEPHNISWLTWYAGGAISNGCDVIKASGVTVERGTYQAIGMRDLARAVRAIAPQNVLMVGGLDWGYDLSQAGNYPLGVDNVLYDTHPFNYAGKQPSDWTRAFGRLASHTAVIAGEFGSYDCGTSYIAQAISYFTAHHMSWLAWNWGVSGCSGPSLLAAWPATPSAPYGVYIQRQTLAAARRAAS